MSLVEENADRPRSRRSLLAAALGAAVGSVAAALGRPGSTDAAAGDPLVLGTTNFGGSAATRLNATSSGGAFWMTQNGSGSGVRGDSLNGHGSVFTTGHADRNGLWAQQNASSLGTGAAVRGDGNVNVGVLGNTSAADGAGVAGLATSTAGSGHYPIGVQGQAARGDGVWGYSQYAGDGGESYYGAVGETEGQIGVGVFGGAYNTTGTNFGVYALAYGDTARALYAEANSTGVNYGVYATTTSASGYGFWSQGNGHVEGDLGVSGTVTGSGAVATIDHPLDPAGKYLNQALVASPEMKTVYDGVATLDAAGEATIELPAYFEALHRDLRYQLTAHGAFSPLYVKSEVRDGRFTVAGGTAGQAVSWQLTGVRRDAWAEANRVVPEVAKRATERGRYLHPALFGQPAERGLAWSHRMITTRRGRAGKH